LIDRSIIDRIKSRVWRHPTFLIGTTTTYPTLERRAKRPTRRSPKQIKITAVCR